MLGLLCALLEGDACLGWNRAKKNPRPVCNVYTSSSYLRDDIRLLCMLLGVRASITTSSPRNNSKESYTICFSSVDLWRLAKLGKLKFVTDRGKKWLKEFLEWCPSRDDRDLVPIPKAISEYGMKISRKVFDKKIYNLFYSARSNSALPRSSALKIVRFLREYGDLSNLNCWDKFVSWVENMDVFWDRVDKVEDYGIHRVYDLFVPDTKVFAIGNGLIVYDTTNFHVPVSEQARKEVIERMMPSSNLFSARDYKKVIHSPSREYMLGIYQASRLPSQKQPVKVSNENEAIRLWLQGKIDANDPVEV